MQTHTGLSHNLRANRRPKYRLDGLAFGLDTTPVHGEVPLLESVRQILDALLVQFLRRRVAADAHMSAQDSKMSESCKQDRKGVHTDNRRTLGLAVVRTGASVAFLKAAGTLRTFVRPL